MRNHMYLSGVGAGSPQAREEGRREGRRRHSPPNHVAVPTVPVPRRDEPAPQVAAGARTPKVRVAQRSSRGGGEVGEGIRVVRHGDLYARVAVPQRRAGGRHVVARREEHVVYRGRVGPGVPHPPAARRGRLRPRSSRKGVTRSRDSPRVHRRQRRRVGVRVVRRRQQPCRGRIRVCGCSAARGLKGRLRAVYCV